MKLYHFTSLGHLVKILKDKELKLTSSNLKEPPDLSKELKLTKSMLEEYYAAQEYKPVVWFTSSPSFDSAVDCGIYTEQKTEVAIEITAAIPQGFYKWDKWAINNGIEAGWFDALKKTAPQWESFYVSESAVNITQNTFFIIRDDIKQELKLSSGDYDYIYKQIMKLLK